MKEPDVVGRYAAGQKVFARINPTEELTVRRYFNRIYYCRASEGSDNEYAYFEREIAASSKV